MQQYGSQIRETLEEAGLEFIRWSWAGKEAILRDIESRKQELWAASDDYAGYVVEINGIGYEFLRSAR
ncbi:hypothetical protein ACFL6S_31515 [Candidatus Poribacteria bacterium]